MSGIRFESFNWQGIVADDFTFSSVGQLAQAYAEHLPNASKRVVIGFDTRFQAGRFAQRTAQVLAANGLEVHLSKSYLPKPALAFALQHLQADGGIMITAGDSPPEYQGFEVIGPPGIADGPVNHLQAKPKTFDPAQHKVQTLDLRKPYFDHLMAQLDMQILGAYAGVVYHDSLGGAGSGWIAGFAKHARLGLELRELHAVPDVMFYGVAPNLEPKNLLTITTLLKAEEGNTFALVTNGDASQVGAVLAGGQVLGVIGQLVPSGDAILAGLLLIQQVASGKALRELLV